MLSFDCIGREKEAISISVGSVEVVDGPPRAPCEGSPKPKTFWANVRYTWGMTDADGGEL